jgi:hypothetical protein
LTQTKMTLLTTKAKVAAKLQTSIGYSDSEFATFIREAQEFDFKPLMREEFYADLIAHRTDPEYVKVIDGCTYTYEGREYSHQGVEAVIDYFAYARFAMNSNVVSTTHGFVVKAGPNSTPASVEERRNIYYKKQQEANLIFEEVKKFIERNIANYPSWEGCKSERSFNTRVIQ